MLTEGNNECSTPGGILARIDTNSEVTFHIYSCDCETDIRCSFHNVSLVAMLDKMNRNSLLCFHIIKGFLAFLKEE